MFTAVPYRGNPLAVVVEGDGLSDEQMQRFANWTNFSETSFIVAPDDPEADYRVRIFTTTTELPFAGHPTLGTCHAWLATGGVPRRSDQVVQQCGIGLVTVARDATGSLAFAAPPLLRDGSLDPELLERVTAVLGLGPEDVIDAAWIDNGPGWLGVLLGSADAVLAVEADDSDLEIGVVGPYATGSAAAYEVRAFFPAQGRTIEDPVTGSLNASVAQWMIGSGRQTPPYTVTQGARLGRSGSVSVSGDDNGQIWIGGQVVTCVDGVVEI